MKKKEKSLPTRLFINESGDLVAGPYNPDKRPDFVELLKRELEIQLERGLISHHLHAYALHVVLGMSKVLNGIYADRPHGLRDALQVVLKLARNRMP